MPFTPKELENVLLEKIEPNCLDAKGATPLWWACFCFPEYVVPLLSHPVNLEHSYGGKTPLLTACHSNPRVVRDLIGAGANVNAVDSEGKNGLFLLLEHYTIPKGTKDGAKNKLIPFSRSSSLLDLFLAKNINLNQVSTSGKDILSLCLNSNLIAILKVLSKGADPNYVNPQGQTILHHLVSRDKNLEKTLKQNNTISNNTAFSESLKLMSILCNSVTEKTLNQKDHQGNSALHLALTYGCSEFSKILIHAGADVTHKHLSGKDPLQLAQDAGFLDIKTIIEVKILKKQSNSDTLEQRKILKL